MSRIARHGDPRRASRHRGARAEAGGAGHGAAAALSLGLRADGIRHHPHEPDDQGRQPRHAPAAGDARVHVQHPRDGQRAPLEEDRLQHRGRGDPARAEVGRHAGAEGVRARQGAGALQAALRRDLVGAGQVLRDLRSRDQVAGGLQGQARRPRPSRAERLGRLPAAHPRARLRHHAAEHRHPPPHARCSHPAAARRFRGRRRHRVRHRARSSRDPHQPAHAPARGLRKAACATSACRRR